MAEESSEVQLLLQDKSDSHLSTKRSRPKSKDLSGDPEHLIPFSSDEHPNSEISTVPVCMYEPKNSHVKFHHVINPGKEVKSTRTFRVHHLDDQFVDVTVGMADTVDFLRRMAQKLIAIELQGRRNLGDYRPREVYIHALYYPDGHDDPEKPPPLDRKEKIGSYFGNQYFAYAHLIHLRSSLSNNTSNSLRDFSRSSAKGSEQSSLENYPIVSPDAVDADEPDRAGQQDNGIQADGVKVINATADEDQASPIGKIKHTNLLYWGLLVFLYFPKSLSSTFCQSAKMTVVFLLVILYIVVVFWDPLDNHPFTVRKKFQVLAYYIIPGIYCTAIHAVSSMTEQFTSQGLEKAISKFLHPVVESDSPSWRKAVERVNWYFGIGFAVGLLPSTVDLIVVFSPSCPNQLINATASVYQSDTVVVLSAARGLLSFISLPPLIAVIFFCELLIAEVHCYRRSLGQWKVKLNGEDTDRKPTREEIDDSRLEANEQFVCVRKHIQTTSKSFQMLLSAYFLLSTVWIGFTAFLSFYFIKGMGKDHTGGCYILSYGITATAIASLLWYFVFILWRLSRVGDGLNDIVDYVCLLSVQEQRRSGFLFQRQEDINTFCDGVKHSVKSQPGFRLFFGVPVTKLASVILLSSPALLGVAFGLVHYLVEDF